MYGYDLTPIITAINETRSALRNAKKEHPNLKEADSLRDTIDEFFRGKIGNRYADIELAEKYKEAEQRLEWKIPPGYEDESKKGPKKYGDTILWFQVIDYACSQKRPIIFVTNDTKEDWWLLHKDQPNQEHPQFIGPRPELIQEMFLKAGVPFYMYQGYQFVAKARKFLDLKYQSEVIKDIRDVGQQSDTEVAMRREYSKRYIDMTSAIARGIEESELQKYYASSLLPADLELAKQIAGTRIVFKTINPFPQIDATYAIAGSIDEEVRTTAYSCDRCGISMSEEEYTVRAICNDCWDEMIDEADK